MSSILSGPISRKRMVQETNGMLQEATACAFCRRRKRSCDKRIPRCSACESRDLNCDYSRVATQSDSGSQQSQASTEWSGNQPLLTPANTDTAFPAVYFLDRGVFDYSRMQLPKSSWTVPSILTDYIGGEPSAVALNYWESVHWWIPIIAKKRFYGHSLNPLVPRNVDVILLLSAMKLVCWHPGEDPRPTAEHTALRHALLEAENAGVLTLQLLQAKILLTLFEFGHAVYPSAYLSVGSCARFGTALGVDKCLKDTHLSISPEAALENEEKKRAWWAILIFDRTMQVGNPTGMLCTEEPASFSYLPTEDESFDNGNITSEPFKASSPASVEMSMFARMSQGTYLLVHLGRVLRFQARGTEFEDESLRQSERVQLDRTLRSLLNLVYLEGSVKRIAVCAQSSICYTALVTLHDPKGQRIDRENFDIAMNFMRPVVHEMSWASGIWFGNQLVSVADASPFLLFWSYQAITIYRRLEEQYGDEVVGHRQLMEDKLRIMSQRWKAGEAYSQILKAREITKMDARR